MSKVQDLHDAVAAVSTSSYTDAIASLGVKPVSQIVYLNDYKPKREVIDDQIRISKKNVGLVFGSLSTLDRKLEDAQASIKYAQNKLDNQRVSSEAIDKVKTDIKKARRNIAIIRFNIAVLKNKLADLGYKI